MNRLRRGFGCLKGVCSGRRGVGAMVMFCVFCVGGGGPAQAALILLPGSNFDIEYDDQQAGFATLGAPALSGNTVFFVPGAFSAQSTNGAGATSSDASFTFRMVARPSLAFSQILMTARGDYLLSGDGSSVSVDGSVTVSRSGGGSGSAPLTLAAPVTINDGILHAWQGSGALVAGPGSPIGVTPTTLLVTLDTRLAATTTTNPAFAFVQQKFGGTSTELQVTMANDPTPVPAPEAVYLLAVGLTGLGALVRRERRTLTWYGTAARMTETGLAGR